MKKTQIQVADLMTYPVITLGPNDQLSLADLFMDANAIRHLPVLDSDGLVCGILSQRDIFRGALMRNLGYGDYLEDKMLDTMLAKEAMVSDVMTTTPTTPIEAAAQTMIEHKIGCLPVVSEDKLVGILTEEDFVRWVAAEF